MAVKVAIIGSGNIGTDLMIKILRTSAPSRLAALVGIDPALGWTCAGAERMGVPVDRRRGSTASLKMPAFGEIAIVFDATSAGAHARHDAVLRSHSASRSST